MNPLSHAEPTPPTDAFAGLFLSDPGPAPIVGGRAAGLKLLADYDPSQYGSTRNFTDAPVSRLSPYLRHGMLSMVEVRDALRERYAATPEILSEFLRQLAWRDFFEKVLAYHQTALETDLEEPKHTVPHGDDLPDDVAAGRTGLPCMDGMLDSLFTAGYLHNHERLWFTAYLCHFRGVNWTAGARLFRQYLLDGDTASNSSSWQWVESTFASKPYFMNKSNINTFSRGKWCDSCAVACPFDASYEVLQQRLFQSRTAPLAGPPSKRRPLAQVAPPPPAPQVVPTSNDPTTTIVWVHDAMISSADETLKQNPTAPVVFVFDAPGLKAEPWAWHRLAFVWDGVRELFASIPNPVKQIILGEPTASVQQFATDHGAGRIATTAHPNLLVSRTLAELEAAFTIARTPYPMLVPPDGREPRRFSKYWDTAAKQVIGPHFKPPRKYHKS